MCYHNKKMEFIIFLSKLDLKILDELNKSEVSIEENTPLCLIHKNYYGFYKKGIRTIVICTDNAKQRGTYKKDSKNNNHKTKIYVRKAFRHESVHAIQECNNNKMLNLESIKNKNLPESKKIAMNKSMIFSNAINKEKEAYLLESKPKIILKAIKRYCL